jgi:hypothetical protein
MPITVVRGSDFPLQQPISRRREMPRSIAAAATLAMVLLASHPHRRSGLDGNSNLVVDGFYATAPRRVSLQLALAMEG